MELGKHGGNANSCTPLQTNPVLAIPEPLLSEEGLTVTALDKKMGLWEYGDEGTGKVCVCTRDRKRMIGLGRWYE